MWRQVKDRETGKLRPQALANCVRATRVQNIGLASHKEIASAHRGAINSLQIDTTESRYLLAGASDGSVGVYDIQQATCYDYNLQTFKHEALFTIDKSLQQGHSYTVSSVHWYPVDTGLFVTGSFDNYVKVWDTNTTEVELQFKMAGKVYMVAMSGVATTHMLIAAGTEDYRVRLCDIATGAFTHTLTGHRDGVWAVQWSVSNEWVLATGSSDGAIRFWDIRRAGCFQVLDQHNSQIGRRPPILKGAGHTSKRALTANGGISSKGKQPGLQKTVSPSASFELKASKSVVIEPKNQRQNTGIVLSQDHATAHYGAVTGLQTTSDGLYLLSAGTDSRVRLWDIESGCNTLVNYPATHIHGNKGGYIAISHDDKRLFVPSANVIQVICIQC